MCVVISKSTQKNYSEIPRIESEYEPAKNDRKRNVTCKLIPKSICWQCETEYVHAQDVRTQHTIQ